jgi:uncharacterized protein YbbK (DUF523 family)
MSTAVAARTGQPRPRIGVSSCLLGEQVRFNGGHSRSRFLTGDLAAHADWVPCCPEMAIGLGAPRETLRLTTGGRLVNRSGTADHTAAVAAVPLPADLDGYVLKSRSPTCGLHGIARYRDGGQPADRRGRGVFAQRIMETFPLLPVEEEGRLNDDLLREAFTERVFAAARLRGLLSGPWRARDLIAFHARHKLQLLAHDPGRDLLAGQVVAAAGRRPRARPQPPTGKCSVPPWPRRRPAGGTPTPCSTPSVMSPKASTGRGGRISSPTSRPTGAGRHHSASRSRCSPITPAMARSPGSPARPTCSHSPPNCACCTACQLGQRVPGRSVDYRRPCDG